MEFLATLDYAAILKIIGIDIMLGVDNAIVIALACAALPIAMRKKAVFWGTAGAVGLRIALLAFASVLIGLTWIKLVAGAYLLFIGYKLLIDNQAQHDIKPAATLFGAMQTIIVADFMMSLDNVLAVTAAAQSAGSHSMVYAVLGVLLSIPIIIYGAQGIIKLMDKYKFIIWIGAGLLGWVGVEMMMTDPAVTNTALISSLDTQYGNMWHLLAKISGFGLVVIAAFIRLQSQKKTNV